MDVDKLKGIPRTAAKIIKGLNDFGRKHKVMLSEDKGKKIVSLIPR